MAFLCFLLHAVSVFAEPRAQELYEKSLRADDVRAVELLVKARSLDPGHVEAAYRLGYLYHKMNRLQEAEKYYSDTLKLKPCHEKALNNMGSIYAARDDAARAEQNYRAAIKCSPDSVPSLYNLANLLDSGAEAEALYLKALAIDSAHWRSHHNLAILYMNRGTEASLKKSELHFERALLLNASDPLLLYNAALLKKKIKKDSEAVRMLQKADRLAEGRAGLRKKIRAVLAEVSPRQTR